MEADWTKWYAMTSHVIAYRSLELLLGTNTFNFNCFFEDFYCVFTQIRCLSRVLQFGPRSGQTEYCSCPSSRLFEIMIVFINDILKKTALNFFTCQLHRFIVHILFANCFCTQICSNRKSGWIWIQTVWHSKAKRKICIVSNCMSKIFRVGTCR